MKEVKNGSKSIRTASQAYNVLYATLHSRIKGTYPVDARPRALSILSLDEEKELVEWILQLSKCGFPVTRDHLLDSVEYIVNKNGKITPFADGRPGKNWFRAFMKRHPELSMRLSQNLTKRRAMVTEGALRA